jgi:hypothetical protein
MITSCLSVECECCREHYKTQELHSQELTKLNRLITEMSNMYVLGIPFKEWDIELQMAHMSAYLETRDSEEELIA